MCVCVSGFILIASPATFLQPLNRSIFSEREIGPKPLKKNCQFKFYEFLCKIFEFYLL